MAMLVWLVSLLSACAPAPVRNPLATWAPSPNHDQRRASLIVVHATQTASAAEALKVLHTRNRGGRVSAHYLIGRDGHIYQLVADSERAWQAGVGQWNGVDDVNSASIGIELDNREGERFPPAQMIALERLLGDLTSRLRIDPRRVIAHADLAPTRRRDPGPLFPWGMLAAAGYGLWPQGPLVEPPAGFDPWLALRLIGYSLAQPASTVRAFHEHYRGDSKTTLDEQDRRVLYRLSQQLAPEATAAPRPCCATSP